MMRVNTKLRRFALLNFNWTLFALKFSAVSCVFLCLNTLRGWGNLFFVLSLVTDALLLKYSPNFDFELTEEESKKWHASTEEFKMFLTTSPKVRLLRVVAIALLSVLIKLFSPGLADPLVMVFFVSYILGTPLVDFLIRKALGIKIPTSMEFHSSDVILNEDADRRRRTDNREKSRWRFHNECTSSPGSTLWCLNKSRKISESSRRTRKNFNSMASQMSIHRPFP